MSAPIRDAIIGAVNQIGANPNLRAGSLGGIIGQLVADRYPHLDRMRVGGYVARINRSMTMSAAGLADAVVAEFHLDEEK